MSRWETMSVRTVIVTSGLALVKYAATRGLSPAWSETMEGRNWCHECCWVCPKTPSPRGLESERVVPIFPFHGSCRRRRSKCPTSEFRMVWVVEFERLTLFWNVRIGDSGTGRGIEEGLGRNRGRESGWGGGRGVSRRWSLGQIRWMGLGSGRGTGE